MQQKQEPYNFSLQGIFETVKNWRKHILIITIIGLVAGVALAFIINPKYEARAVFFIPANNSISKSVLSNTNLDELMQLGSNEQTDQILQLLSSDLLKENVIKKFNLTDHYRVSPDALYRKTIVKRKFDRLVNFKRTDYLAVEINVLDESPQLAANMANYITYLVDSLKTSLQKNRAKEAFDIIKQQFLSKDKLVDSLQNNLEKLRSNGVYDFYQQTNHLNSALLKAETESKQEEARVNSYTANRNAVPDTTFIRAKARLEAAKAAVAMLKPQLTNISKYGNNFIDNQIRYEQEKQILATLRVQFDNARVDYEQSLTQKFIIDKAEIPEMKVYPVRWLVVLISVMSAFFIAVFIAVLNDLYLKKSNV